MSDEPHPEVVLDDYLKNNWSHLFLSEFIFRPSIEPLVQLGYSARLPVLGTCSVVKVVAFIGHETLVLMQIHNPHHDMRVFVLLSHLEVEASFWQRLVWIIVGWLYLVFGGLVCVSDEHLIFSPSSGYIIPSSTSIA
jgi:hypothetical protein